MSDRTSAGAATQGPPHRGGPVRAVAPSAARSVRSSPVVDDEMARLRSLVKDLRGQVARADEERAAPAANRSEFHLVVESMPQIVWIARPDGWHTYFNRKWCEFTGLTLEQSLGHGWNPPFHPDDRPRAAALWQQATSTGEPYEIEYRLRRADGTYHWMLGRATPMRDEAGDVVSWFGTCTDIEELKQAQTRIEEQARLLDLAQDAIYVKDLEHRLVYWNSGAERIYGWSAQDVLGHRLDELVSLDRGESDAALEAVHARGEWSGELHCTDRAGAVRVVQSRWTLLLNADGSPKGVLAVNTDVTERRATEATFIRMLEAEATHDPLTGLPNRALLTDRLDEAVAASRRDGTPLAVLFVDLDAFKDINDGGGHLLGDKVLVEVAKRLAGVVRERDTVARFGGDEFVLLLPETDVATADSVAERLLAAVHQPMEVEGHRLHVSASIGVAVSPPVDPDALLRCADAAVYQAKSHGRAQVRAFVGQFATQAQERVHLSGELLDALDHDHLQLVYQPVVDLASGDVVGVEALARWPHPVRGAVPPDVFVILAEETGLARRLDAWVVRRACREMADLRRVGDMPEGSYLAVNVTASSVADPAFPSVVEAALADAGLPATALVVEVTETSVMRDMDAGIRSLAALRALGVRVAIDDFGTGWSSLSYLKRLPASILKLDRSFVARLHEGEADLAIAASVVALAQATGLTVVAEGVETAAQLAALQHLRCAAGQGYLWHRGVPPTEVAQAVRRAREVTADGEPVASPESDPSAVPVLQSALPAAGGS